MTVVELRYCQCQIFGVLEHPCGVSAGHITSTCGAFSIHSTRVRVPMIRKEQVPAFTKISVTTYTPVNQYDLGTILFGDCDFHLSVFMLFMLFLIRDGRT